MKKKSTGITFLMWFFLGLVGGHRFYTGHYITGIIQLLTFGGFGLWWLMDLFYLRHLTNGQVQQQQPTIVINNSGSGDVTNK